MQSEIDSAVKALLELKATYKASTGKEWTPQAVTKPVNESPPIAPATVSASTGKNEDILCAQITECGNKVRDLKAKKAEKVSHVCMMNYILTSSTTICSLHTLSIRVFDNMCLSFLKSEIDAAVKDLLSLKTAYKTATGLDWTPTATATKENKPAATTAIKKDSTDKKTEKVCSDNHFFR